MSNLISVNDMPSTKQKSISTFFKKAEKTMEENPSTSFTQISGPQLGNEESVKETQSITQKHKYYKCPICDKEFSTLKLLSFNQHVDKCLMEGNIDRNENPVISTAEKKNVKKCEAIIIPKEGKVNDVKVECISEERDNISVYECPVCQKIPLNVTNLQSFNKHVDACLTQGTIRDIISSEKLAQAKMKDTKTTKRYFF